MIYCEECRQDSWPKNGTTYSRWGKCDVCGTTKYCYSGPDALKKEAAPTRADWNKPTEAEQAAEAVHEATRLPYAAARVLG